MPNFALFTFDERIPYGGWEDFHSTHDNLQEAQLAAREMARSAYESANDPLYTRYQVVDLQAEEIVSHGHLSHFNFDEMEEPMPDYTPVRTPQPAWIVPEETPAQAQLSLGFADGPPAMLAVSRSKRSQAQLREAAIAYRPAIKDMPEAEQPVNRLAHYGARALATAELLAVLLATPHAIVDAEHMLLEIGGGQGSHTGLAGLAVATLSELQAQPGIGLATAARIKAALELGRRLLIAAPTERPIIHSPGDAANLLMAEMRLLPQEHLRTVLLDTRNQVIGIETVHIGSVNFAQVRVAEVFRQAIRKNAVAMVLVHNHPSGAIDPSPEDVRVTRMIVDAGKLLNIDILDHLIIGNQRYVSLKERGLGFN